MSALQRVTFSAVVVMGVAFAVAPGPAQAQQNFPSKPIRVVVPFSPGGTSDVLARMIGQKMSENWNQAVVIN